MSRHNSGTGFSDEDILVRAVAEQRQLLSEGVSWARDALDSISNGITLCDATMDDLPLIYVNAAFERMCGFSGAEVYGRNCRFLQGTDTNQDGVRELGAAIRAGRATNVMLRNYRKDGTQFWNELYLSPIYDAAGRLTHFMGIQNDVTERVEAEGRALRASTALHASEAELRAVFDSLQEGIAVLDRDHNVVHVNHAAAELLGVTDQGLSSRELGDTFEVFQPDGTLVPRENWLSVDALRGLYTQNCELHIRRKDNGAVVIVEVSSAPVLDEAGEASHILLVYRDITLSRKADEARLRLASIVESSQDAIIGKDGNGIVTSWNRGAEKLFGYKAEEMVGQTIRRLLPADRMEEEDDILARIHKGETVEHIETERVTKSGEVRSVSLTISPIRDGSGNIIGASKIARDISERKQLERRLRQSERLEAIGQLTGGIAHDFNNLLGVIVGNLDLLERMVPGDEEVLKRIRTAQKGAERGADLTRRLLRFSSKESLAPKVTSLNDSVSSVIDLAARVIGRDIHVKTHFEEELPPIFADAGGLESALLNLIVNARDAMPEGGTLTISTELRHLEKSSLTVQTGELAGGAYACVSVTDSGCGMSQEVLDRAFEPFFTTKAKGKGTGLGLAMVYGFVKQSGGAVRIYSEQDYGTKVALFLPFATELVPHETTMSEQASVTLPGGTVLVVDDEEDLLDIAVAYLKEMGFEVHHAHDSASALAVLAREPDIVLIVTDIVMPGGMNGVELSQRVRRERPGIRVIYCSGFPADALAEKNLPLLDGPLLLKPYQRAEFRRVVGHVMKEKSPLVGNMQAEKP